MGGDSSFCQWQSVGLAHCLSPVDGAAEVKCRLSGTLTLYSTQLSRTVWDQRWKNLPMAIHLLFHSPAFLLFPILLHTTSNFSMQKAFRPHLLIRKPFCSYDPGPSLSAQPRSYPPRVEMKDNLHINKVAVREAEALSFLHVYCSVWKICEKPNSWFVFKVLKQLVHNSIFKSLKKSIDNLKTKQKIAEGTIQKKGTHFTDLNFLPGLKC